MRKLLCLTCLILAGVASADVDFSDVIDAIGATYETPEAIPPSNAEVVSPGCRYDDSTRFTVDLTKAQNGARQTYLFWLHPKTLARAVVHQWLVNFQSLSGNDYPAVDWATAGATLNRLEDLLSQQQVAFWKVFTVQSDVSPEIMDQFQRLDSAGLQLPYLRLTEGARIQMHQFFMTSNFLSLFNQGGLGNLTLDDFFHTPADPATVSDDQITQMITAINLGFFRRDFIIDCEKNSTTAALHVTSERGKGGNVHLAVSNMCCSKVTRTCVSLNGLVCTMCSTFCCLGGVNFCP